MLKYILKRLVSSIITIWFVITVTFFLMHAIPGGPFTGDRKLPPAVEQNLNIKYGLNKPLGVQYEKYLTDLLHGDLGPSMTTEGLTVNQVIGNSFPSSLKVGICAILFALSAGLILGIIAALKQGKFLDNLCMMISTVGVAVPSMILAPVLIYVFAVKFGILPAVGLDKPSNYIMPAIALGLYYMAFIARLIRSSLVEVIRTDYVKVARAKGLSKGKIILKHVLRNSLIPLVTYLGPITAGLLTGSFVIESVFGIPGIGREFVQSISNRDYTTTLGVTVFFCAFLIVANLIVDLLYVVIDPRIKLHD
ncbi:MULTISPECIES: ABC transporter permease [Clostridium]|uniref:ABC transporter permease n=1 Tax=Clostridium TaxID=1485 RepID=UPI00069CD756|nr:MULTISPECIES: ABC transporter permease [Clostridium]KOF55646.1 peptide ABC transporter permease [Clostridium sp. DMHC 10]MCD2347620.1 ABC transporter permease [Clostridium guangxiense]